MTLDQPLKNPVFVALDTADLAKAEALTRQLAPEVGGVKLGLEFFTANGPDGVRRIKELGLPLFLDLKLHDIPNTVANAIRALSALQPDFVTVHVTGGRTMLEAAATAAQMQGANRPRLLGVTVLTSLDSKQMTRVGLEGTPAERAEALAIMAVDLGLDGVVCSGAEAGRIRAVCGSGAFLAVPGIRPAGSDAADQVRVVTPEKARAAGADILVIGRPITGAPDPVAAARSLVQAATGDAPGPPSGA